MIVQKYIVMLSETPSMQMFLAYDDLGRIGNATYEQAFRYDTEQQARCALRAVRRIRAFADAKILATCVDSGEVIG